jgi:beta-glucanase (GH16 family)
LAEPRDRYRSLAMIPTALPFLLCSSLLLSGNTTPARTAPDDYKLVWAQEFDTPGRPDPAVWGYERGFVRNREAQWYQPENARIEDGLLIIEARRERVENPRHVKDARDWRRRRSHAEYTSASLTTRGKHQWLYGRFEMRAKIDTRAGSWPAWWTLGTKRGWPACGEVDIMEYYDSVILANACWARKGRGQHWDAVRLPLDHLGKDWAAAFHVWRMDWDEDAIMIYVDDRLLNTIAITHTRNPDGVNPFREPHYMIVNLAIGGTRGGDPSATEFPVRYEIDYIRVYQQREEGQAAAGADRPDPPQRRKQGSRNHAQPDQPRHGTVMLRRPAAGSQHAATEKPARDVAGVRLQTHRHA